MNGGLAAKIIIPNSDNPANGSASYAEELSSLAPSSPARPHAATGGRRRLTPLDSPSSSHPPPDCAKLSHGQNSQSATCTTSYYPACGSTSHAHSTPTDNQTDTTSHMTWVDLLQPTLREKKEENRTAVLEYEIESIIIVTEGRGEIPNTRSRVGRLH